MLRRIATQTGFKADAFIDQAQSKFVFGLAGVESTQMSPANLILGCSVFLAALGGLVASCLVVNATTATPKIRHKTIAAAQQTTAKIESTRLSDTAENDKNSRIVPSKPSRLTKLLCVDWDGKTFGWDWPNVPFGAIECHDADRK